MTEKHHAKFFGGLKLTIVLVVLFVILFCLIFIPFNTLAAADEEIIIGALLPLTGADSETGIEYKNGIELALEDVRKSGHNVKVKYVDTKSDPYEAIDGYFKLVHEGVQVIIGPVYTNSAQAIAPYAEMYEIPVITFANGKELDEFNNFVFRFAPSDKNVVTALIRNVDRGVTIKTLAVVWNNDQYSSELAKYIMETFEEEEPDVELYSIPLTSTDAAVNQIIKNRPGVIFVIPENAEQLSELCSAAYNKGVSRYATWITADTGFGQELIENIDCLHMLVITQKKADKDTAFNKEYLDKFGIEAHGFAPYGYDALKLAADVTYSAGNNGPDIAKAMKTYRAIGKTGPVNFDEKLNRFPLLQLIGAGYKTWYTVENKDYVDAHDIDTSDAIKNLVLDLKDSYHAGDQKTFNILLKFWSESDYSSYQKYKAEKDA